MDIRDTFEIMPEGTVFVDGEEAGSVDEGTTEDPTIQGLIQGWKTLEEILRLEGYGGKGFSAHAFYSKKKREAYLDLDVRFSHEHEPGTGKDLPPDREGWKPIDPGRKLETGEKREIRRRITQLMRVLKKKGWKLSPSTLEGGDTLTNFGVKLETSDDSRKAANDVIELAIEFGVDRYLWGPW